MAERTTIRTILRSAVLPLAILACGAGIVALFASGAAFCTDTNRAETFQLSQVVRLAGCPKR
jgi:hypothetical protein